MLADQHRTASEKKKKKKVSRWRPRVCWGLGGGGGTFISCMAVRAGRAMAMTNHGPTQRERGASFSGAAVVETGLERGWGDSGGGGIAVVMVIAVVVRKLAGWHWWRPYGGGRWVG